MVEDADGFIVPPQRPTRGTKPVQRARELGNGKTDVDGTFVQQDRLGFTPVAVVIFGRTQQIQRFHFHLGNAQFMGDRTHHRRDHSARLGDGFAHLGDLRLHVANEVLQRPQCLVDLVAM